MTGDVRDSDAALMTSAVFREVAGISESTAARWRRHGIGPTPVHVGPRGIRYKTAEVERFLGLGNETAAYDALLVGVECVLLDHSAELSGPNVDANLAELAHRYLAVVGDKAPAEIRDAVDHGADD